VGDIDWNQESLSFTQLNAFRALAKNGNISKAAELLHVSQPSVSKHLKNLEDVCRAKLFERRTSPIELTEAGRILLRHADIIHSQLSALKKEFNIHSKASRSQPLRIAGSFAVSALLLPSVVATFKRKYRNMSISLRTCASKGAMLLVLNSNVEVALITESPTHSNLASEPFREEKLVLFASPNHPLTKKEKLNLSDLNGTTLVAPAKSSTADKFMKDLVHEGFRINISMHCGTQDSVKTIVKKGIGVGILFRDFVMPECRKKVFKLIEIQGLNLNLQSYIVYRKDRPLSQAAQEFLTLLREKGRKRRDLLTRSTSIAV
jgi:DNA-binding transcriptional LysR family regulator